jgi:hypothetical protein
MYSFLNPFIYIHSVFITKLTDTSSWTKRTLPIWDSSRVCQPRMKKVRARNETIRPCLAGSKRGARKRAHARCARGHGQRVRGYGRMGDLASRTESRGTERRKARTPAAAGRNSSQQQVGSSLEVNGNPMPSRQPNPRALAVALAFHARSRAARGPGAAGTCQPPPPPRGAPPDTADQLFSPAGSGETLPADGGGRNLPAWAGSLERSFGSVGGQRDPAGDGGTIRFDLPADLF